MAALHSLRNSIVLSACKFSRIFSSPVSSLTVHTLSQNIQAPSSGVRFLGTAKLNERRTRETPFHQETVHDSSQEENRVREEIVSNVNTQITSKSHGRLFAVVHLVNKQWKITTEDVILVEGYWPPVVGDVIRLEKVLLLGSTDFTLVGMPLLQPDLVDIQATVLEKRLSHTRTSFRYIRRKQTKTTNFYRKQQTVLRIDSIEFGALLNQQRDIEGLENRIF